MSIVKTDPKQPVNEFLCNITRELADKGMNTVVFAAPFELQGQTVYVKYQLSVMDIVGLNEVPSSGSIN